MKAEEDMKKNHQSQKVENQKIQGAITILKTEKTNLHQHLLDLKRRVAELELQIGDENCWTCSRLLDDQWWFKFLKDNKAF